MFNVKRAMVVSGGVFALAAATAMTVAAGPGTSMASGPALTSHASLVALTTNTSRSHVASGAAPTALQPSPSLNTQVSAPTTNSSLQDHATASLPSAPTKSRGQGNSFGTLISTLARLISPSPDHGKVISFFAKSLNHGHTK